MAITEFYWPIPPDIIKSSINNFSLWDTMNLKITCNGYNSCLKSTVINERSARAQPRSLGSTCLLESSRDSAFRVIRCTCGQGSFQIRQFMDENDVTRLCMKNWTVYNMGRIRPIGFCFYHNLLEDKGMTLEHECGRQYYLTMGVCW